MKFKGNSIKALISICIYVIVLCFSLSVYAFEDNKSDSSIVFVKNSVMSVYGTGFAVGMPGKDADTIVTAYSVVATQNGSTPKTALVTVNESEKDLSANVVYCDEGRNVAVLKLCEPSEKLKPLLFTDDVDYESTVYVRGYDGTGNIMSDFEHLNSTDIVQYSGNISNYDDMNSVVVYKYSNEFNRAAVGGPALNKKGNAVGMCGYSLSVMNTYSQYILSSEEIENVLLSQEIEFMTVEEVFYQRVIILSIVLGILLCAAMVAGTVILVNKKKTA